MIERRTPTHASDSEVVGIQSSSTQSLLRLFAGVVRGTSTQSASTSSEGVYDNSDARAADKMLACASSTGVRS